MSHSGTKTGGLGAVVLAGVGGLLAGGSALAASSQVLLRSEGETVLIAQDGTGFRELRLGDTPEAAHLRQLLRETVSGAGTVAVPVDPFIVANGGGGGDGAKPKPSSASSSGEDRANTSAGESKKGK